MSASVVEIELAVSNMNHASKTKQRASRHGRHRKQPLRHFLLRHPPAPCHTRRHLLRRLRTQQRRARQLHGIRPLPRQRWYRRLHEALQPSPHPLRPRCQRAVSEGRAALVSSADQPFIIPQGAKAISVRCCFCAFSYAHSSVLQACAFSYARSSVAQASANMARHTGRMPVPPPRLFVCRGDAVCLVKLIIVES